MEIRWQRPISPLPPSSPPPGNNTAGIEYGAEKSYQVQKNNFGWIRKKRGWVSLCDGNYVQLRCRHSWHGSGVVAEDEMVCGWAGVN